MSHRWFRNPDLHCHVRWWVEELYVNKIDSCMQILVQQKSETWGFCFVFGGLAGTVFREVHDEWTIHSQRNAFGVVQGKWDIIPGMRCSTVIFQPSDSFIAKRTKFIAEWVWYEIDVLFLKQFADFTHDVLPSKEMDVIKTVENSAIKLADPKEVQLAMALARFPEAVEALLEDLAPNKLCDYMYDLSGKYNEFYAECKVSLRMQLCSMQPLFVWSVESRLFVLVWCGGLNGTYVKDMYIDTSNQASGIQSNQRSHVWHLRKLCKQAWECQRISIYRA